MEHEQDHSGTTTYTHIDRSDDSVTQKQPNVLREDVVRNNRTGRIGVVISVAGDSYSESEICDEEEDDDVDDDVDEAEGKKPTEENVGSNGNAAGNLDKKNVNGNYKCGVLEGEQIRVRWIDNTEQVLDINDVTSVDRWFILGDNVTSAYNPTGQVGVVVDVNISVDLLALDGSIQKDISTKRLKHLRDFVIGEHVVHGSWLGKVYDLLENVTVLFDDGSMCKCVKPNQLKPIYKNNLENVNFQYHPGQRVKASSSSIFKNYRGLSRLWKPNRLEGTVTKVTSRSIFVNWITSSGFGPDSSVPPSKEQCPSNLTLLTNLNHAEWGVGYWGLFPSVNQSASIPIHKQVSNFRLYDSQAKYAYRKQKSGCKKSDSVSIGAEPMPKETQGISSISKERVHKPWPLHRKKIRKTVIRKSRKVKKKEESLEQACLIVNSRTFIDVAWQDGTIECRRQATTLISINNLGEHEFFSEQYVMKKASDDADNTTETGIVKSVNAKERTAIVRWLKPPRRAEEPREFNKEEIVSVYELESHSDYDYEHRYAVVRLSPVNIASSAGNSLVGEATDQDHGYQDTEYHQQAKILDEEENKVNTNLTNLSWFGYIAGLKDGYLKVTWADRTVSLVDPHAVSVIRHDDDESIAGESEASDAASWETVNEDDRGASEILEENIGRDSFIEENSDGSGRNDALALPLAAIGFVTEDSASSNFTGENGYKQTGQTMPCDEMESLLDDHSSPKFSSGTQANAEIRLCGETSTILDNEALERSNTENSAGPVPSEGDSSRFKRFDVSQGPLDHHFRGANEQKAKKREWFKKVGQDWKILENNLPDGIFVRVYEDRMDLLRAVIVGPYGSPYQDGLFFFDFHLPPTYPNAPPSVYYHSGGWKLNPNLYEDGKICLSLLNTWYGKGNEVWDPKSSTILQILVSLQGLVLNSKPYFNEAGYDEQNGTVEGEKNSVAYNENTFLLNCKTMMYLIRIPPQDFEEIIKEHFRKRGYYILKACDAYMKGYLIGSLTTDASVVDERSNANSNSVGFKLILAKILAKLFTALSEVGADCNEFKHLEHQ